jgi:type IV pilus assembly protein PilC
MTTYHKKWNKRDTAIFFERLELYLSSGLTIDMALKLCKSGVSESHKKAVEALIKHTESGALLSSGLMKYLRLSKTLSGMISHGETTGGLASAINMVRTSIEKQEELTKKCVGAMIYPLVIGLFSVVFVIGLIRGVLPQIVPMLQGLHMKLPLLTRMMIVASNILVHYGLYITAVIILLLIIFIVSYEKSMSFRYLTQAFLSHFPLVGKLFRNYNIVVFLRSLGSLIDSGLSVSYAFNDSVSTLSFLPVQRILRLQTTGLSQGLSLERALEKSRMAQYIVALVSAGELSGTLGASLLRAANILDRDIEHSLKKLTSLIEPLMMIGLGVIVGSIALSIIMPIYDISKVLQK